MPSRLQISHPPPDFHRFWNETLKALDRHDPDPEFAPHPEEASPEGASLQELTFISLDGERIRGYALWWNDDRPRPLVVHAHGYNGAYLIKTHWVRAGLNVIGVDTRGHGRSTQLLSRGLSPWGRLLTGVSSPETSLLRGAVCDLIQAMRLGMTLLGGRISRRVYYGYSYGGWLAMMAQGLTGLGEIVVAGVPSFGWVEGRRFFAREGSGWEINRYLERFPEAEEDVMNVLRYFDPVHVAGRIRVPTLIGWGESDAIVPAVTVRAIAAHLSAPHELMSFPVSHSDRPEEIWWGLFDKRLMELANGGAPTGFGADPGPIRIGGGRPPELDDFSVG